MKTAIVQFNPKTANIDYNFDKIKSYLNDINSCDLIIFPALSITGINCRDYFLSSDFIEKQNKVLDELTILSEKIDIMIGCVEKTSEGLFSSIAFFSLAL